MKYKWGYFILFLCTVGLLGCAVGKKVEMDPLLPIWASEHLDELGYYSDVSDNMIQEYFDFLADENFREINGFGDGMDPLVKLFVRDDAWVYITYPYYDNWYKKTLGYEIIVIHETGQGNMTKAKAASIIQSNLIRAYGEEKLILAMLERTPDNLSKDSNLQVFRCLIGDLKDNYFVRSFLVGEKSILDLWNSSFHILYPDTEGDFKDKVILLRRDGYSESFAVIIQIISSTDSNPASLYGYQFYMDQGRISLCEHDGKIYFVHERMKIPVKPKMKIEYEKPEEYELSLIDGRITIIDPQNKLNIHAITTPWEEHVNPNDPYDFGD